MPCICMRSTCTGDLPLILLGRFFQRFPHELQQLLVSELEQRPAIEEELRRLAYTQAVQICDILLDDAGNVWRLHVCL